MRPPRTLWTILLFGLILAAVAYPAATAREHKDADSTEETEPLRTAKHERSPKGPPSNESEKPREAGKIVQSNLSGFDGRYVSFEFDSEACTLTDYRVYNLSVLQTIQLPSPCDGREKGRSGDHGAALLLGGEDGYVRVHDAPNGLLHWKGDVQVTLAANATVNESKDSTNFTIGNLTGVIRTEQDDNESRRGRFWVHPLSGGSAERIEIREAIKERRVAGEIDVLVENGSVSSEVLTYEEVLLRAQRGNNGSFRFLVDANLTSGRTFVVNLGPGVFEQEKVGLRYWDLDETSLATEVPITEADSLEDVLEIAEGEGPEYWVTQDKAGKHVLVAVPHFSAHVFEISSVPPQVVPIVVWGLIGGLAFVGLGAAGMFRRRSGA